MKQYNLLQDYVLIEEISHDAFGKSFLAKKVVDNQPKGNYIVVRLHRYISDHSENIDGIRQYVQEIRKSTIPNLLRPEELLMHNGEILLVYPRIKGKNLKSIIDELEKQKTNLEFKDVIAMVLRITHLIDTGSAVILKGRPSYHGFLIPENVLIDYEGEIYLKYYGLLSFLCSESYSYIKANYKIWLAPELIRQDKIHYRSEIYYLGHVVYRLLTGKYFSVEPTDFEQAVTNISFNISLPTTDTSFISSLLEFFQRTLHPEMEQRMAGFDEFTSYISEKFSVTHTYAVKPTLARILHKLFPPRARDGDTVPIAELLNNRGKEARKTLQQGISADDLKKKLAQKSKPRKSRAFPIVVIIAVLCIVAVLALTVLDNTGRRKQESSIPPVTGTDPSGGESARLEESSPVSDPDSLRKSGEKEEKPADLQVSGSGPDAISPDLRVSPRDTDSQVKTAGHPSPKQKPSDGPQTSASPAKDPAREKRQLSEEPTSRPISRQPGESEEETKAVPRSQSTSESDREETQSEPPPEPAEESSKTGPSPSTPSEVPLVPLSQVTEKPVKIAGEMVFSDLIKRNYPGRRRTLEFSLLIDEKGSVCGVRLFSSLPDDLKAEVTGNLQKWKYRPARVDSRPVRVWIQDTCRIEIR